MMYTFGDVSFFFVYIAHEFTSRPTLHSQKLNNTLQTYVKKAIKMEEAEELKTKLEAAGATVEIV